MHIFIVILVEKLQVNYVQLLVCSIKKLFLTQVYNFVQAKYRLETAQMKQQQQKIKEQKDKEYEIDEIKASYQKQVYI